MLILYAKTEFWMYVHDKGEEFYLHYDFWPNVPYIHHSKEQEQFVDIVIRKELEVQNDNCDDIPDNYFGKIFYHYGN